MPSRHFLEARQNGSVESLASTFANSVQDDAHALGFPIGWRLDGDCGCIEFSTELAVVSVPFPVPNDSGDLYTSRRIVPRLRALHREAESAAAMQPSAAPPRANRIDFPVRAVPGPDSQPAESWLLSTGPDGVVRRRPVTRRTLRDVWVESRADRPQAFAEEAIALAAEILEGESVAAPRIAWHVFPTSHGPVLRFVLDGSPRAALDVDADRLGSGHSTVQAVAETLAQEALLQGLRSTEDEEAERRSETNRVCLELAKAAAHLLRTAGGLEDDEQTGSYLRAALNQAELAVERYS